MANDSKTWRCGKYELSFDRPRIMGVLNVTPDSFSDGGEHFDPDAAIEYGLAMLDAGADKPLPFLTPEDEPNPALGLRGLRTLRAHMDVLEGQLKALAAADAVPDANLWVMAPMVADQHEADYFVKLGKSFGLKFVGAMAEVPSIALMADKVADVADFVSIGTNDLTQYTLAADRTLGSVANYQTAWHPAVLRAIKMIWACAARPRPIRIWRSCWPVSASTRCP